MADVLMLRWDGGVSADKYHEVDTLLGIDAAAGTGDIPSGLIRHIAAIDETGNFFDETGNFFVVESWESRQAQEQFKASRLGLALGQAGVPEPTTFNWYSELGNFGS